MELSLAFQVHSQDEFLDELSSFSLALIPEGRAAGVFCQSAGTRVRRQAASAKSPAHHSRPAKLAPAF